MINACDHDLRTIASIFKSMRDGEVVDESPGGIPRLCRGMNHALYTATMRSVFEASIDKLPRPRRATCFLFRMMAELTKDRADALFGLAAKS
jgi:hypothetical protein